MRAIVQVNKSYSIAAIAYSETFRERSLRRCAQVNIAEIKKKLHRITVW